MYCEKCGHQIEEGSSFCPSCGNVVVPGRVAAPAFGMKWYKFLIYFALFAGAVLNLVNAVPYLTGSIYGEDSDLVYGLIDGLQILDKCMGLALIGRVVLFLVTRFSLAKYRENGPKLVVACYASDIVLSILYIVGLFVVYNGIVDITEVVNLSELVMPILVDIAMIVYNVKYFKDREELFVN